MIDINRQFMGGYTLPDIALLEHPIGTLGMVGKYLKSKQQVYITLDEMDEFAKDEKFWFYESDASLYNRLESVDDLSAGYDFSDVTNLFGISEYIGVYEKYLPSFPYLQHAKINGLDILLNVYDAYSLYNVSRRPAILKDKVEGHLLLCNQHAEHCHEIHDFEFNVPEIVNYAHFVEKHYEKDVMIPCFQDPVHLVSVNLPYNFYAYQPTPPNIYNWDVEKQEHLFGGMSSSDFMVLVNEVCINGITSPLFMRMNGEILSSNNLETNIILFIAKLLRLPSIPVTLYLSNEDIGKNHLVDALINYTEKRRSMFRSVSSMNHILDPYMVLNKSDQLLELTSGYQASNYRVFSSDKFVTVRYLDNENTSENLEKADDPIAADHEKLRNEASANLSTDVEKMIQSLLGNTTTEQVDTSGGN